MVHAGRVAAADEPVSVLALCESDSEYLANLFSIRSLDLGFRRVLLALGLRAPSDPAGYWDYETGHEWNFRPAIPDDAPAAAQSAAKDFSFPAVTLLADVLGRLPAGTPVVVVMPPVFFTELPRPGSEDAARLDQCKQAVAAAVAARPRQRVPGFHARYAGHARSGEFHGPRALSCGRRDADRS